MLKILRSKKTAKKVWIILAIAVIPAFCLWGFGSAIRERKQGTSLGEVFGKPITAKEYIASYKAIRNRYLIQFGEKELRRLEKYLNLESQAWERIILLKAAKLLHIKVSDKEVIEYIKNSGLFQKNGNFDPRLYRETITYIFGSGQREFEEETRDNLTVFKLFQEKTKGINISDEEIKEKYIKENEKISLDYITAQNQDFIKQTPKEIPLQEQQSYYNNNQEQFRKPVSYNLEYISIESSDRETREKINQLINDGVNNLSDIAKNTDLEIKQTGLFSINEPVPGIGWSLEIIEIIPQLDHEGRVWPQPISSPDLNSIYFLRLKEKKESYIKSFDEVNNEIIQKLRQEKASLLARKKIEACLKQLESLRFTKAARRLDLKTGASELFKRGENINGLGQADIFFDAVENLEEGKISEIISTPSGFYIVKLKQRLLPDEEEFNQKKQDFGDKLLGRKKEDYFAGYLAELKNRADTFLAAK